MQHDDSKRCSRWILRVMEWDEPKAQYPNIWHEGLPSQLLLLNRAARRLRLGDLVAVFYPQSQQHAERSEKFVGLTRVVGLSVARQAGHAWVELEAAHRFAKPVAITPTPHRVFLCCDPGWPGPEVELFRRVFDAAVAEGWRPAAGEHEPVAASPAESKAVPAADLKAAPAAAGPARAEGAQGEGTTEGSAEPVARATPKPVRRPESPRATPRPEPGERTFAGVEYSGDMRDPKDRTWLAVVGLKDDRLRVIRLNPTGRAGIQAALRDPDRSLLRAEAIGMDFPFALPQAFAESLLEGPFPEEGFWALVKRFEGLTRPAFLAAVHEFREAHGELKRFTDQQAQALSPLHRGKRDLSPMTYHGLRMIGEDRSRFAVRPFESAQARLLLEVNTQLSTRNLLAATGGGKDRDALIECLKSASYLPVQLEPDFERRCHERNAALDAVIAARAAVVAVLTGEAERTPDELGPSEGHRVRLEGWIYGLNEPSAG